MKPKEGRLEGREKRKSTKSTNQEPNSLLFVDRTKDGSLITKLRTVEGRLQEALGSKIKLVEKVGNAVKNILWKPDPWGSECKEIACKVCKEGDEKRICNRRNIVYRSTCLICKDQGKKSIYIGETSRTLLERAGEH